MSSKSLQAALFLLAGVASARLSPPLHAQQSPYTDALLDAARALAHTVPGDLPRTLRYYAFGNLTAPLNAFLEGATDTLVAGVYAVFQIKYANGWIMVDAGVDREVETDTTVHLDPERYNQVQAALRGANLILVTHEHHDHVAGAIRTNAADQVIPKTLLTRQQLQTLLNQPNSPLIRLTPAEGARYLVIDYTILYPVAPGVVLLRAPGHTPGSQMVYVHLASDQEVLLVGDIAWMMAGIRDRRQKPAAISHQLGEDREALQQQLDWLSGLGERQHIVLANCHDAAWLKSLVQQGILKEGLDLGTR
jgi:glyoxylase-like metal-dependent hydrolase (beta-lactamase superfamily II)